eukprot:135756-Hanusia_phi.AAC.2
MYNVLTPCFGWRSLFCSVVLSVLCLSTRGSRRSMRLQALPGLVTDDYHRSEPSSPQNRSSGPMKEEG